MFKIHNCYLDEIVCDPIRQQKKVYVKLEAPHIPYILMHACSHYFETSIQHNREGLNNHLKRKENLHFDLL